MTTRDIKILEFINRLGKCTTGDISTYFNMSKVRTYQIVSRLKRDKLILSQRIFHNKPAILTCSNKGAKFGSDQGIKPITNINVGTLKHDLLVNEFLIKWLKNNNIIEFQTERELRQNRELDHYPDLLLIDGSGQQTAIEIELSRKSLSRISKIQRFYLTSLDIDQVVYYVNPSIYSFISNAFRDIDLIKIKTIMNYD